MPAMAGDDREGPDLELPSLFGRRRRRKQAAAEQATDAATEQTRPLRATGAAKRVPPTPPPSARPPAPDPEPQPEPDPLPEPPPRRGPDLRYDPPPARPVATPPEPAAETTEQTRVAVAEPPPTPDPETPRARRMPTISLELPRLPTLPAAALTGLVVAITGVGLTWLILQGCTAVRGVSSCGGIGLLGVLVVVLVQVLVGATLLAALHVTEPRSTAVLGVGLLSCLTLVLGYASAPTPVVALVLLALAAPAYVVAARITGSSFVLRD